MYEAASRKSWARGQLIIEKLVARILRNSPGSRRDWRGGGASSGGAVIGAIPLGRGHLVPAAAQALTEKYPPHRITILEGACDDLATGLRSGDVDFLVGALCGESTLKGITETQLFADPLSLIMRPGNSALNERRLTLKSIRD